MVFIRSAIYFTFMVTTGIVWGLVAALFRPLPIRTRFALISLWAKINLRMLSLTCGLRYEVQGRENIPQEACIILSKHQSTWETMVMQELFPPVTWVLKKQLLLVPGFGWGLAALEPVAIDRNARKQAMQQVIDQGTDRLKKGWNVVIFPEGTRIAPGKMGKFKLGGARLAVESGFLAVPVALNPGEFWRRHSFLKYPGTIQVVIGKPINPAGMTPEALNAQVFDFISSKMDEITTLDTAYRPQKDTQSSADDQIAS